MHVASMPDVQSSTTTPSASALWISLAIPSSAVSPNLPGLPNLWILAILTPVDHMPFAKTAMGTPFAPARKTTSEVLRIVALNV